MQKIDLWTEAIDNQREQEYKKAIRKLNKEKIKQQKLLNQQWINNHQEEANKYLPLLETMVNRKNTAITYMPKYKKNGQIVDYFYENNIPRERLVFVPKTDKFDEAGEYSFIINLASDKEQGIYIIKTEDLRKCPMWFNWNKAHTKRYLCFYAACTNFHYVPPEILYSLHNKNILKSVKQEQKKCLKYMQEQGKWLSGQPDYFLV